MQAANKVAVGKDGNKQEYGKRHTGKRLDLSYLFMSKS